LISNEVKLLMSWMMGTEMLIPIKLHVRLTLTILQLCMLASSYE